MIESSIEIGVEIFTALVGKAYKSLTGYAQEHDFFKTATRKYLENIREDFGQVRVLGMKERVPLDSLYVRANVLEKISIRTGDLPEEMEQNRALFLSAFGKTIETVDGEEIVNRNENLIVLGKPGAGKTTYLKYLTLRMASKDKGSKIKQRRLPIFVILHEFAKSGKTLLEYMAEQFELCGFKEARPFIERLLLNGDALVLLDGLDEVSRETCLDAVIQEVSDFTRKYRESKFVVSCRIATYNHQFDGLNFKEVEIADFNKGQIEDFVAKYFQKELETGQTCWQKLEGNERLLEMATSPLLLTLLCIVYDERQDFPPNRAMLYGRAMDALLSKWDAERRIKRDKLYKELDESRLLNLLSRLAAGYFESDVYFIGEEELKKGIGQFLADLIGEEARNKSGLVLQDIEQHYGLIVRRSQYAFSFSHLTFMEYFTAQYIVDKAVGGSVSGLVESHFGDERWLEVFLLTAGKLGHGADAFLLMMHKKNRELLQQLRKLNALFKVAGTAVYTKCDFSPEIRKAYALHSLLQKSQGQNYLSNFSPALHIVLLEGVEKLLRYGLIRKGKLDENEVYFVESDKKILSILGIQFINLESFVQENKLKTEDMEKIYLYLSRTYCITQVLRSGAIISSAVREKVLADMFRPLD